MLNLTPHAVVLHTADGSRITLPPSGHVARVAAEEVIIPAVDLGDGTTIPVITRRFGQVMGLPEDDEPCIVSSLVFEAVRAQQPWRRHIYAPDTGPTAIRDDAGSIVAVTRLVGVS